MLLRPNFTQAPAVKILINIGGLMDVPTGEYLRGIHGEYILNGGLGMLTGVVGTGNLFKSTILHYMMMSAMSRVYEVTETSASTYDTEINIHESRLKNIIKRFAAFIGLEIFEQGIWTITDKTVYYANEWYTLFKEFIENKKKNISKLIHTIPFLERDGKTLMKMATPTFSEVDSFSEFETADVAKIQEENELGDSGGNTIHMRQGLAKTRFLMEVPTLLGSSNHFMLLTAQVGKDIQMAAGPMAPPPVKKLQFLKNGDKIKGVTDKFFFLMSNCWQCFHAAPLINQGTKGPEFPRNPDDNFQGDTDLNIVSMRQLRSKSGMTGYVIQLIVSQSDGVLPELSEFYYLKETNRFGISGTLQHYSLDLLPDVKLSRTTVRNKIDTNPTLCRALNITAEMCQLRQYHRQYSQELLCTPKELYDDLIKLGYDWDMILNNTRGYWTMDNDDHPVPYLSTLDLLRMRMGLYHPYWLEDDKKTIKPKWAKKA